MRNHKDDDPNFKIPKIKENPIKNVYKKPVIEKKSGIDAPQNVLKAPDGNIKPIIIAPQEPVIAEGISKLKLRLIATEELKLTKESKLTEIINTLNQNKLKLGQINESIYKMGVIDDKASKEIIKARQYLG